MVSEAAACEGGLRGSRRGLTPSLSAPADSVDRLVKQLSEAFGAEAAEPPGAASPAEEPAPRSSPPAGQEAERPPSPSTARPARPAGHGLPSGECFGQGHCAGRAVGTSGLSGAFSRPPPRQSLSLSPSSAVSHRLEPLRPVPFGNRCVSELRNCF